MVYLVEMRASLIWYQRWKPGSKIVDRRRKHGSLYTLLLLHWTLCIVGMNSPVLGPALAMYGFLWAFAHNHWSSGLREVFPAIVIIFHSKQYFGSHFELQSEVNIPTLWTTEENSMLKSGWLAVILPSCSLCCWQASDFLSLSKSKLLVYQNLIPEICQI